jgi:hypothetical protein
MLAEFCNWLIRTPASVWIQSTPWAVPAVQTVHILAIAIVLTYNLMLGLRLMGVAGRSRTYAQMAGESMPWVWGALAVLAATGLILIVGEPARELRNAAFWSKMAMLAVAITVTFTLQRRVRGNASYWDESPARRQSGKVVATVSMILWVSIAVAGRLIAYVPHG